MEKKMIIQRVNEILQDYLCDEEEAYAYILMYFENNKKEHNSKRLQFGKPSSITPNEFRDEPEGYDDEPDDGRLRTRTMDEMLIPETTFKYLNGAPWDGKTITQIRRENQARNEQVENPLMVYEFVNPSDPYTFEAPDHEVAALVVGVMGTAYGAETKDDADKNVPVFILGGYREWYQDTFGRTAEEGLKARKQDVAEALGGFLYGRPDDRKLYKIAMDGIQNPEIRKKYAEEWHNRRSSMTDIGEEAWRLGKEFAGGNET